MGLDLSLENNLSYDDLKREYGTNIVQQAINNLIALNKHFVIRDIAQECELIRPNNRKCNHELGYSNCPFDFGGCLQCGYFY